MPQRLSLELLDRLDTTLRDVGAAIVEHWAPGLTRAQMDALTEPHGFRLPDEAATWWAWHNGGGTAELIPHQRMASLEISMSSFEMQQQSSRIWGLSNLVRIVNEQPRLSFDCRVAQDELVPVYVSYTSTEPVVGEQSIGDMVLTIIRALEAGGFTTNERGEWNEPHWEITESLGSLIL